MLADGRRRPKYRVGTPGYSRGTAVSARLLRRGRGAARAVPSCAGAYVSGAAGSNACPAGYAWIEAEAACRTAAIAAGKAPGSPFVETDPTSPRGCYTSNNNAFFNTDPVGAGYRGWQLLCAATAITTGALPSLPMLRRVCTGASAPQWHVRDRACGVPAILRRHVGVSAHCGLCGAAATLSFTVRCGHCR